MVAVGAMNQLVKFEKNTPINVPGGPGKIDSFEEFLTCFGYLRKNSGVRLLSAGEIAEDNRYTLEVWYQDALYNELYNSSVKSLKIIIDNRKFTISSWEKLKMQPMKIQFTLNEQR